MTVMSGIGAAPEPEPTPVQRVVLALDAFALAAAELADALEESDF